MTTPKGLGVTWPTFRFLVADIARCFRFPLEATFLDVSAICHEKPLSTSAEKKLLKLTILTAFHYSPIVDSRYDSPNIRVSNSVKRQTSSIEEDFSNLAALAERSFLYIASKKNDPTERSNESSTSVHFFGVGFDVSEPSTYVPACVLAIKTERNHIVDAVYGKQHNAGKPTGLCQIADEVIDLLRQFFILAVAVGLEQWTDFPWIIELRKGYVSREHLDATGFCHLLDRSILELRSFLLRNQTPTHTKDAIKKWLHQQLPALGKFVGASGISVEMLCTDLRDRLSESKGSPSSTTKHERVPFPRRGMYAHLQIVIADKPGRYQQIIRLLAEQEFNLWASRSKMIVPGESALVELLIVLHDNITQGSLKRAIDDRLNQLCRATISQTSDEMLVIAIRVKGQFCEWDASTPSIFFTVTSQALRDFHASPWRFT